MPLMSLEGPLAPSLGAGSPALIVARQSLSRSPDQTPDTSSADPSTISVSATPTLLVASLSTAESSSHLSDHRRRPLLS